MRRDDSPLAGAIVTVTVTVPVDHHPILDGAQIVGAGGIGIERRVVSLTTQRVQYGQPRLAGRVIAPWCKFGQTVGRSFRAILLINREQFVDGGLVRD